MAKLTQRNVDLVLTQIQKFTDEAHQNLRHAVSLLEPNAIASEESTKEAIGATCAGLKALAVAFVSHRWHAFVANLTQDNPDADSQDLHAFFADILAVSALNNVKPADPLSHAINLTIAEVVGSLAKHISMANTGEAIAMDICDRHGLDFEAFSREEPAVVSQIAAIAQSEAQAIARQRGMPLAQEVL